MAIDSEFSYGYVVGQLVLAKSDGDDLNRLPDFLGQNAKVTFTRTQGQYVQPVKSVRSGIRALMVSHQPVIAGLMSDGTITGDVDSNAELKPDAKPGLWLVIGQYNVDFGGAFPSTTIEVKDSHTEDSPLDIASTIGYKPAPNHVVTTVELPTGGEPGQVYGWSGSSVGWYTPEPGPSAYEVALRNGFSGTVDAWLLSLKGGKGDPGLSAYEVARSRGFSGTVDEWLASLKGLKGDPGFSAYQLAKTNGFTGTVTEWLDSLVGRQGDPGPPGSPTEYIKVGAGRPDQPATTNGMIAGNEPVGAEYRSEDGAGVGAYVWTKRPGGKWGVTDGDTGWRNVGTIENGGTVAIAVRRTPERVEWRFTFTGTLNAGGKIVNLGSIPGFGPSARTHDNLVFGSVLAANIGNVVVTDMGRVGVLCHSSGAFFPSINLPNSMSRSTVGLVGYPADDPWPSALPGTPA